MKFSSPTVLAVVPILVAAHADHLNPRDHVLGARQVTSPSPSSSIASGSSGSAGLTATPLVTTTLPSVTLLATNPTAVPLSVIVSNQPSSATQPLATTAVPGTTPSDIANAPALPNGEPAFFFFSWPTNGCPYVLSSRMAAIYLSRLIADTMFSQPQLCFLQIIRLLMSHPELTPLRFNSGFRMSKILALQSQDLPLPIQVRSLIYL